MKRGSRLHGPPAMSVHAITLTSYTTKRVQNCTRAAQVVSDKRYPDLKSLGVPDSPLTLVPRIPTILFPEDELPRPAVIGVRGSYGSYPDSATAIKEILSSVLKLPSSAKSPLSANTLLLDNDMENSENSSIAGNEDSDSEAEGVPLLPLLQNDIRFHRNKAAWDNAQLDSPNTPPLDSLASSPRAPITSTLGEPDLEMSTFTKCKNCFEVISPGPEFISPLNLPVNLQKQNRRFSSPSIAPPTISLYDTPPEQFTLDLNEATMDTEASTIEEVKSFPQRSQSCTNLFKVTGNSQTPSTEALHNSRENLFEPSVSLEKENEHFLAADLFISLVEMMKSKWQYEQWRTEGGMYWLKKDAEETCYRRHKANSESAVSTDSGYEGLAALQNSPADTIFEEEEDDKNSATCEIYEGYDDYVIIEMDDGEKLSANKTSCDKSQRTEPAASNSAEETARNLYRAFRQQWTQVDGDMQLPARLTIEKPSCINAIPEEFETSVSLVEEIKRIKMRETEEWSPPRFQIISTVQPYIKRDVVVESQNYLCAGCGTKVEPRYTSRLRYCDYLGKYFCDCCHHYSESSIPGRILSKWNFSKYYVCNFSKNLLDKIWDSHTFNVQSENPDLYKKVKDLNRVKEVQQQLIHIGKLVTTCRFADGVVKAFENVPSHLTKELHLFTLADLYEVKQKTLLPGLRELLALAVAHVEDCELCSAKGFICEFCQNPNVIFPFQTEICRRCEACKACYHKECFKTNDCPKCLRIKAREALRSDSPFTSSGEVDTSSTTGVQ
ncbi:protein associated with UVRAG as autophagy enhancer isoform X2 [Hyla sarda]|uniref:protein associated with UVRAG as autophagy enhancer isoform X2 n=1 Tax=Hyla sarda TaxID=327740 RepID=UPI0024C2F94F|nr:protein associated with UVRAG as autophagy enhancer isoform X2 [Hyla sarda]